MMRKSILLLLCLGWLSACEREPEPVAQQPAPAPAVVTATAPVAEVAKPEDPAADNDFFRLLDFLLDYH